MQFDNIYDPLTTNAYYTESDSAPGTVYGELKFSLDEAGQKTYYAYDSAGHTVLTYTLKTVKDATGAMVNVWVGTTDVYNAQGLLTETYEATYRDTNNDGVLDTAWGGPAGVQVSEPVSEPGVNPVFASPVRTVHNEYNASRQLISSTDRYGGVTSTTYDANGKVIRTVYPNNTEVSIVYDALGREVWKSDRSPVGYPALLTHTLYNSLGQVTSTERYQNGAISISSVKQGSVYVNQSALASSSSLVSTEKTWYDEQGRVIETKNAAGLRTGTVYYPDGRVHLTGPLEEGANPPVPDGGWLVTPAGAPSSLRLRRYAASDFDPYTEYRYDQYDPGLDLFYDSVFDAYRRETRTYKDTLGREVRTTYADTSFTETLYSFGTDEVNRTDKPESSEGWTGVPVYGEEVVKLAQRKSGDPEVATYYLYDRAGRLTDVWLPEVDDATDGTSALAHPHWSYEYDTAGNMIRQLAPAQQDDLAAWEQATQEYAEDFAEYLIDYEFWVLGGEIGDPPEEPEDPGLFEADTVFEYDQFGRQVKRELPSVNGTRVSETWAYDEFGRMEVHVGLAVESTQGPSTAYVYDETPQTGGRLLEHHRFTGAVDASPDEVTVYTYDALGRKESVIEYKQLDADPELEISRDMTTWGYDAVTRQVTMVASPEGTLYHAYDPATALLTDTWTGDASKASSNTHVIYGYDRHGRLASVTSARVNGTDQPDPNPSLVKRFDASGNEVAPEGPTTLYTYDLVGNLETVATPNGVVSDYDYDALNRLDLLTVRNASTNKLFEQDYVVRNDGKRDHVIEKRFSGSSSTPFSKVKIIWKYDAMGRLVEETRDADSTPGDGSDNFGDRDTIDGGDYSDAFAYDLSSNRVGRKHGWDGNSDGDFADPGEVVDETVDYTFNERDQLLSEDSTDDDNDTTYGYDDNGSTTLKSTDGQDTTYTWDLRNRMIGGDALGTDSDATYAYDADGVRVAREVDGVATHYLNDGENPTGYTKAIEEGGDLAPRSYVLGLDLVAQVDDAGNAMYFLKDGRGFTRALLDGSGEEVSGQRFDFDAFSKVLGTVAPLTEWLASDGRLDAETGFTYSLARYRDGWRFASADDPRFGNTEDPISLHKYLYVHANPIAGKDPSGQVLADTLGAVLIWAGEQAQDIGKATMLSASFTFVASLGMWYATSVALWINPNDAYARKWNDYAVEAMWLSGIMFGAGALAYLGGSLMISAGSAMLAVAGTATTAGVAAEHQLMVRATQAERMSEAERYVLQAFNNQERFWDIRGEIASMWVRRGYTGEEAMYLAKRLVWPPN